MNPTKFAEKQAALAKNPPPLPPPSAVPDAPSKRNRKKKKKKKKNETQELINVASQAASSTQSATRQNASAARPIFEPVRVAALAEARRELNEALLAENEHISSSVLDDEGPVALTTYDAHGDGFDREEVKLVVLEDARRGETRKQREQARAATVAKAVEGKTAGDDAKFVLYTAEEIPKEVAQVNHREMTFEDTWYFTEAGLQLAIPLGKWGQPHFPGWEWGRIHPNEIFKTGDDGRIDTKCELFKKLAGEVEQLDFASRSPTQRLVGSLALREGVLPQARAIPEPDVVHECRTNPFKVPFAVHRVTKVDSKKNAIYTDWDAIDLDTWIMHRLSRPKPKRLEDERESNFEAGWIEAVLRTLEQAHEMHAQTPFPHHHPVYPRGPQPYQGPFGPGYEERIWTHLRRCGIPLTRLLRQPRSSRQATVINRGPWWDSVCKRQMRTRPAKEGESETKTLETDEEYHERMSSWEGYLALGEYERFLVDTMGIAEDRRRLRATLATDPTWVSSTAAEQMLWVDVLLVQNARFGARPVFRTKEAIDRAYKYVFGKRDGILHGKIPNKDPLPEGIAKAGTIKLPGPATGPGAAAGEGGASGEGTAT